MNNILTQIRKLYKYSKNLAVGIQFKPLTKVSLWLEVINWCLKSFEVQRVVIAARFNAMPLLSHW